MRPEKRAVTYRYEYIHPPTTLCLSPIPPLAQHDKAAEVDILITEVEPVVAILANMKAIE